MESPARRVETRIGNRLEELEKIVHLVDQFCAAHGIPGPIVNDLNLVLDEVLNNIVSHGYPGTAAGSIWIRLDHEPGRVPAEIEDDGSAFEPLPPSPLDRSVPPRERPIGGAGLRFIHGLMDEVAYARIGGHNRLRLTKRVPL